MSAAAREPTRLGATLTFAARIPPLAPSPEASHGGTKGCSVYPKLWQACASSMCTVPLVGAVF
jgi:hypothetical protein